MPCGRISPSAGGIRLLSGVFENIVIRLVDALHLLIVGCFAALAAPGPGVGMMNFGEFPVLRFHPLERRKQGQVERRIPRKNVDINFADRLLESLPSTGETAGEGRAFGFPAK